MTHTEDQAIIAFLMTLGAGLSTGVGSLIAFFSPGRGPRFLCASMGFSAGVMLYVAMGEIMIKGRNSLALAFGERLGYGVMLLSFFGGMGLLYLLDRALPEGAGQGGEDGYLARTGVFTALAIGIHNLPEGMATFMSALEDPSLGWAVVMAIAIHNIPEGIGVALPLVYGGEGRGKAFLASLLSGLAEPLGALTGYLVLRPFISDGVFGITFSAVAGIMVYISLDQLIPTAESKGGHSLTVGGIVSGMAVMGVSLGLFL